MLCLVCVRSRCLARTWRWFIATKTFVTYLEAGKTSRAEPRSNRPRKTLVPALWLPACSPHEPRVVSRVLRETTALLVLDVGSSHPKPIGTYLEAR